MESKGEGSRGGVIIGHTESGLPIYQSQSTHVAHKIIGGAAAAGAAYYGYRKSGEWSKSLNKSAIQYAHQSGRFHAKIAGYEKKAEKFSKAAKSFEGAAARNKSRFNFLYRSAHNSLRSQTALKSAEKAGMASIKLFGVSNLLGKISRIGKYLPKIGR